MALLSAPFSACRLTAFVLKAFAQAQSHIFIEKTHITRALNWLSGKQKENGCFQQSGHLLNNAMKVMPWSSGLNAVVCREEVVPWSSGLSAVDG